MSCGSSSNGKRMIFGSQSSQCLILDSSVSPDVMKNILKALQNVLSLGINLSGPSRIPMFCFLWIGDTVSSMFPMQDMRSNTTKLIEVLDSFFDLYYIPCDKVSGASRATFMQAFKTATYQYLEALESHNTKAGKETQCKRKLEITVVSSNTNRCMRGARGFCRENNVSMIKRIVIVPPKLNLDSINTSAQSSDEEQLNHDSDFNDVYSDEGIIELQHLQSNKEIIFEDFFKYWLLDNCSDQEHLKLFLPGGTPAMVLKCDLQECVLNPSSFPWASDFYVETNHTPSRSMVCINGGGSNSSGRLVAVYQMEAIARVPTSAVCDSLVFGMPCLVRPTVCWHLDLNELSRVNELFLSLCHQLSEEDSALVLRRVGEKLTGYFLLIPAGDSFLLKSLSSRELFLPRSESAVVEPPSLKIKNEVRSALNNLRKLPQYNPVYFENGLFTTCSYNYNTSSQNSKRKSTKQFQQFKPGLSDLHSISFDCLGKQMTLVTSQDDD